MSSNTHNFLIITLYNNHMLTTLTLLATSQLLKPEVNIEVMGEYRYIKSNGIPNHSAGPFPNRENPNAIRAQTYLYKVPVKPTVAQTPTKLPHQHFGVAINGVPFDPLTAEYWNRDRNSGWNYEAIINGKGTLGIDQANAHVQPTGAYHYHSVPLPLVPSKNKMTLIGWAADGFPMYAPYAYTNPTDPKSPIKELRSSYQVKNGTRSSGPGGKYDGQFTADWEYVADSGDLDEFNGRTGITPEFPNGTFYYVVTNQYPWIPRLFKGTPDSSFNRRPGPPPGGRPGGRPGGPPPETHTHGGTTHTH